MNSKNKFFSIALVVLSISLGACSTAADMDEIIDNTEISAPAPSNGGLEDSGEGDNPAGGNVAVSSTLN